jgi:hypothetical protein
MAYTQADIDRLKQAIATGAKRVRLGSGDSAQETEFRSLDEMERLLATLEAEVNPSAAPPLRTVGQVHSGLHPRCHDDFWRDRC